MHIPKKFKQGDLVTLKKLMIDAPFASLMTYSNDSLEVNHLPFILKELNDKTFLQGHIAKANPLWKSIDDNSNVLVVFNGPNCYISPNYYPTKKEHGKAVPTWNYVSVHVKGVMSFVYDDNWNLQMVRELTTQHESSQKKPWSIDDAPEEYIQKMLPAIVGVEIEVSSIVGQWKLSQNQPEKNQQGIVEGLLQEDKGNIQDGSKKIAALIQKNIHNN